LAGFHVALLSRERSVVVRVTAKRRCAAGRIKSAVVAEASPARWDASNIAAQRPAKVKFDGAKGWIDRSRLWGTHDGEQF